MGSPSTFHAAQASVEGISPACAAAREGLDAFVDGELDELEAAAMLAHLQKCPRCRNAEVALRRIISIVQQSQLSVLASRRLRLRVAQLFAARDQGER